MAESRDEITPESFSAKKDNDVIPVDPCESWILPCVFCDRRFGEWREANEKHLAQIPDKPGILEMGLRYSNMVEVVNIILDTQDIQKVVIENVDQAKKVIVEDKKYKYKWPVILCRWVTFKPDNEKAVTILCAHWYNNGVLPYLMKDWLGLDILQKTKCLTFSNELQKWCYSKKKGFYNKPLQLEVVKGCTWAQCEICDTYFTQWKRLDSVVTNDRAPASSGIFILAVSCERQIKVLEIACGPLKIKYSVEWDYKHRQHILTEKEYADKNAFFIVRWMEFQDCRSDSVCFCRSDSVCFCRSDSVCFCRSDSVCFCRSDSACFLYAHWLNADPVPLYRKLPGKEILERNQNFFFRTNDNKWYYVTDTFKHTQTKTTKSKQKNHFLNELKEDLLYLDCSGN